MIYLASPYSHDDQSVQEIRFQIACRVTADLIRNGHAVFSPVVHSHPLTKQGLPVDWDFWKTFDRDYLSRCDALLVLTIRGWEASKGIAEEIEIATQLQKPVWYHNPSDWPDTVAPLERLITCCT